VKLFRIITGWFRSQVYTPKKIKKLSEERLEVCKTCPFAVETKFLNIIRGEALEEKKKACKFCGCPIKEKSLVETEECELNLW